jgi:hypothetical protein
MFSAGAHILYCTAILSCNPVAHSKLALDFPSKVSPVILTKFRHNTSPTSKQNFSQLLNFFHLLHFLTLHFKNQKAMVRGGPQFYRKKKIDCTCKYVNTFHICVSVRHQSIALINQLDAALCSLIYSLLRFTLHVSGAFCTHHQEYN